MEEKAPEKTDKRGMPLILSYDWRSSGFYPWRLIFFMAVIAIIGIFVSSHINIEFEPPAHQDKYPESVFFINDGQMFASAVDQRLLPLSKTGPVWADPVTGGMDGELFFPLGAGLSERSAMKTLGANPFVGRSDFFVNYLALAPVNANHLVHSGGTASRPGFVPVVDAWDEGMGEYYFLQDIPETDTDLRGVSSSFWVRVNGRGAPESIVLMESSRDDAADEKSLDVVRKLRWLPNAGAREGMVSIDWEAKGAGE